MHVQKHVCLWCYKSPFTTPCRNLLALVVLSSTNNIDVFPQVTVHLYDSLHSTAKIIIEQINSLKFIAHTENRFKTDNIDFFF